MKGRNSGAVMIFICALLIVIFFVGMAVDKNPGALSRPYRYNLALDQFGWFCAQVWLPAGDGFLCGMFSPWDDSRVE